MAWKELLQQQEQGVRNPAEPNSGSQRDRGSLIRQVCGENGLTEAANTAEEPVSDREPVILPDGYERRSPVQEYHTSPDYMRRRVRKVIIAVLLVIGTALVVLALIRGGLFRFT